MNGLERIRGEFGSSLEGDIVSSMEIGIMSFLPVGGEGGRGRTRPQEQVSEDICSLLRSQLFSARPVGSVCIFAKRIIC